MMLEAHGVLSAYEEEALGFLHSSLIVVMPEAHGVLSAK